MSGLNSRRAFARIAVIDSGVQAAHPHVQGVAGGVGIDEAGEVRSDYVDRLGHGTAVAAVIREKAPAAELWVVKVFDRELRTTGAALLGALRWARTQGVDLINLSLGTTNVDYETAFAAEIALARDSGIVLVCAAPQQDHRWLPGALTGVVRVASEPTIDRDVCELAVDERGHAVVRASAYPRPIPGVPPERNLRGVSFAVANTTGILARTWPDLPPWANDAR